MRLFFLDWPRRAFSSPYIPIGASQPSTQCPTICSPILPTAPPSNGDPTAVALEDVEAKGHLGQTSVTQRPKKHHWDTGEFTMAVQYMSPHLLSQTISGSRCQRRPPGVRERCHRNVIVRCPTRGAVCRSKDRTVRYPQSLVMVNWGRLHWSRPFWPQEAAFVHNLDSWKDVYLIVI